MEKTHWKQTINLDYIGAYCLGGKDLTVKITKVGQEQVTGDKGKKEMCLVAHLDGQKPFIINRTNAKTISKIYNTPYIEDWVGKHITLYPTTTSVGGEVVECLRIRQTVPQVSRTDYSKSVAALRECKSIEQLQQVYTGLPKDHQTATVSVKDEMKQKLSAGEGK